MRIIPRDRPLVYVASPITTYPTRRYERMLARVRARFPDCRVLAARDMGFTPANWPRRWARILLRLDHLIAFPGRSRVIGAGVLKELFDAQVFGIPTHVLTDEGAFIPLGRVGFSFIAGGNLRQFARVEFPGRKRQRHGRGRKGVG